jgi:hypothetical protein
MRRKTVAVTTLAFVGGVAMGLVVWSGQTRSARRHLFSSNRWRRLAALGHLRGQRSLSTVHLLRDYIAWEAEPGLRRQGSTILRQMEHALG